MANIHPTKHSFKLINHQFIVAGWNMVSTAKSVNVGFRLVVQLFATPTSLVLGFMVRVRVSVIFHPYGRKSRVEFRYFPSVQTDGATLLPKVVAQTK